MDSRMAAGPAAAKVRRWPRRMRPSCAGGLLLLQSHCSLLWRCMTHLDKDMVAVRALSRSMLLRECRFQLSSIYLHCSAGPRWQRYRGRSGRSTLTTSHTSGRGRQTQSTLIVLLLNYAAGRHSLRCSGRSSRSTRT